MTESSSPAVKDWDEAVLAVLERAGRLTRAEAAALDAALRARPDVEQEAWRTLRGIEREGNFWNTRPDWQTPFDQWHEARRRVAVALDVEVPGPDDGSAAWGAATAAACAVLGSWASRLPALREPWDLVINPR